MKIYTKKGDKGETSLYGGKRLSKAHLRIETYGTVDELNSYIGLVRDVTAGKEDRDLLKEIQDKLFSVGAAFASDPEKPKPKTIPDIVEKDIQKLEQAIDDIDKIVEPLQYFILPGGHVHVSYCHIARCVCRRAERMAVALAEESKVEAILIKYLNRLSDFLFAYGRKMAKNLSVDETKWMP